MLPHTIERRQHAVGEQADVEPEFAGLQVLSLLGVGQKVQQQRGEAVVSEHPRYETVARAEARAPGSVREDHEPAGAGRHVEVAEQFDAT